MDRNLEATPSIDFLNEKTQIIFDIDPEAARHLPEVEAEDLETRREKFRVMAGAVSIDGQIVRITIKGVIEMEEEEVGYYTEGVEEVRNVNLRRIKGFVENLRQLPEYADWLFVGDIHTHPVLPKDFRDNLKPWSPSPDDIADIIKEYESGVLTSDEPYIFGIAGPDGTGETQYVFYRLVRKEDGFRCVDINHSSEE